MHTGQTACFSDFPKDTSLQLARLLPLDAFAPIATKLTIRITRASGLKGNKFFQSENADAIEKESSQTNDAKDANNANNVKEAKEAKNAKDASTKTKVFKTNYSCEVRLNGRSLVRSKFKAASNGDPNWNEKHEVWIDKRINLSTSILTFWVDQHSETTNGRIPLGVITLQRELITSILNLNSKNETRLYDKSRQLRQYTPNGSTKLGEKVGGSLMVGFSINDEENDTNGSQDTSTTKDELDNNITMQIRQEERRKENR